MAKSIVNTVPYPFEFTDGHISTKKTETNGTKTNGAITNGHISGVPTWIKNSRGRMPSLQASKLRNMIEESHQDSDKIAAVVCSYDALSSRLVEEAGFPFLFLAGYAMASAFGLPDTGYIAFQEVAAKVQEVVRCTNIPILVDGDTGYGGPVNVRRTVEGFAHAGAAGVMIEDQVWPKRESCNISFPI